MLYKAIVRVHLNGGKRILMFFKQKKYFFLFGKIRRSMPRNCDCQLKIHNSQMWSKIVTSGGSFLVLFKAIRKFIKSTPNWRIGEIRVKLLIFSLWRILFKFFRIRQNWGDFFYKFAKIKSWPFRKKKWFRCTHLKEFFAENSDLNRKFW